MTRPASGGAALVLRVVAAAIAATALTWGIALPSGVAAAVVGAAAGVIAGQILGRSSLRIWSALAGVAGMVLAAHALARFAVDTSFLPARLGTGSTLRLASVLRYGSTTLGAAAALRAIAARRPLAVAIELAAVAAAATLVFASHRYGVIARPLWLGDWSWQRGIDPVLPLLVIGGATAAVLALLLLAEGRSRRAPSAFLVLVVLVALTVLLLRKIGMPETPPPDLGLDGGAGDAGADASPPDGGGSRGGRGDGGGDDEADGGSAEEGDGGGTAERSETPPDLSEAPPTSGGDTPMAVVILDDDYAPPAQAYYFRQDAWSELNGVRLVRATRAGVDTDVPESFPSGDAPVSGVPPTAGRAVVHTTVALLVDHPRPFALESPTLLAPLRNPDPVRFKRAYRVTSVAESAPYGELFGLRAGDPTWPPDVRAHYLAGPDDPRYAALARAIVADLPERRRGDPFAMAVAVKLRLDDTLRYSTRHPHAGAADPTADFLFGDRIGYCVHFAHAAVYLWRALGIPARVGVGYEVDEDTRHGGSAILVRSRNAHAWPELYLEGRGWIVLDVAPKTNLDPPSPPVDTELERMLGEMARSLPPDPSDTGSGAEPPGHLGRDLGIAALAALAVLVAALYAAKVWRRIAPRFARAADLPWVGYRGALDMLSEVGARRRFGEGREAFAERVRAIAPSFAALTALHLRAALGGPGGDGGSREAWREGLGAVRREIRAAAPLGRRVLGAIDPVSFLGSR